MIQKRPFRCDSECELSNKRPQCHQLVSFPEVVIPQDACRKPHSRGGSEHHKSDDEDSEKVGGCSSYQCLTSTEEFEASTSKSADHSAEEASLSLSLIPELFDPEHKFRTFSHVDDIYHLLLEHPSRKIIPIGPDHQAELPECSLLTAGIDQDLSRRLLGLTIIPMPNAEPPDDEINEIGKGRCDCDCNDQGSVRCIKQHIIEERERLRDTLGEENFAELGFFEMGEFVAERWSELDEQLFHDVVFSHAASADKNLWVGLSVMFPFRSKKELVSYYFNVFILRCRTEQNRCIPIIIDSDDDEWLIQNEPENDLETSDQEEYHVNSLNHQEDLVIRLYSEANPDAFDEDESVEGTIPGGIFEYGRNEVREFNSGTVNEDLVDTSDSPTGLRYIHHYQEPAGESEHYPHLIDNEVHLRCEKVCQEVEEVGSVTITEAGGTNNEGCEDESVILKRITEVGHSDNFHENLGHPETNPHYKSKEEAGDKSCLNRECRGGVEGGPVTFTGVTSVAVDSFKECSGNELSGGTLERGCQDLSDTPTT